MKVLNFLKNGLLVIISSIGINTFAQPDYSDLIISGERNSYPKIAIIERGAVPYAPVREADIKYTKRVIRCIDVRQKTNKVMTWPRSNLSQHLLTAIWEGSIVSYRNDSLESFYQPDKMKDRFGYSYLSTIAIDPEDASVVMDTTIFETLEFSSIKKYWVLEEWNFNSKLSVFRPRIIALAPIYNPIIGDIQVKEQPLCWIKYDDVRNMFSNWEVFNRYNDGARLSYDDWFEMRLFDSYIIFENNVFDYLINEFQEYEDDKIGALLKAEDVRNDLFIFEHDLWQY